MGILDSLKFRLNDSKVLSDWEGTKPTSFPPHDDFVVSIDKKGKSLSRYGDDSWDFRVFGGSFMHFGKYSNANKNLFKQVMFVFIYHHALFPGAYVSLTSFYSIFQKLAKACEDSEIRIDELYRFPNIIEKIVRSISPSYFGMSIFKFEQLLSIRDELGFVVLDEQGLKYYSSLFGGYELGQTPAIPPRIWNHFIQKSDAVLDDFLVHEKRIKRAFDWISNAYKHNQLSGVKSEYYNPFDSKSLHVSKRKIYKGNFEQFLDDYDLRSFFQKYTYPTLNRWNGKRTFSLKSFSKILTIGREISFYYIQAYTLMRESETKYVRYNGLHTDEDSKYGNLFIVESRTTKTEDDSEAFFPTSSSVEKAFKVGGFVAKLRMQFAPNDTSEHILQNPFIATRAYEPWSPLRESANNSFEPASKYSFINKESLFIDDEKFNLTEEDYQFAVALTPSLMLERNKNKWFKVGNPWKFSDHQFRRTLAVQMNEFGVSGSTIQYCMKHRTRQMQNHYTKNSSKILTNRLARQAFLNERIQQVYLKLADVIQNESGRYVKPYSKLQSVPVEVINLIEESNFKKLAKQIKAGKTGVRLTILGICVKKDMCEYGGIESISPCMGEHDGSKRICGDAVLDKQKKHDLRKYVNYCKEQQKSYEKGSPSFEALEKEIKAGAEAIIRMEAA